MSEDGAAMLNLLAHKRVHPAINPQHVAYCPTMDLIALATVDQKVHVYRLNGQDVFGVASKQTGVKVNQIKWKPNGARAHLFLKMRNDKFAQVKFLPLPSATT